MKRELEARLKELKEEYQKGQGQPLFTLVNEAKYNEIKSSFVTLGQQIIDASNAIPAGTDRKEAQKKTLAEAIDLNSYRLDAGLHHWQRADLKKCEVNPIMKK